MALELLRHSSPRLVSIQDRGKESEISRVRNHKLAPRRSVPAENRVFPSARLCALSRQGTQLSLAAEAVTESSTSRETPEESKDAPKPNAVRGADKFPDELVTLQNLVTKLSNQTDGLKTSELSQLKEAFGVLAKDIKRQLATTANPALSLNQAVSSRSASPRPKSPASPRFQAWIPSDLEGLIPLPKSEDISSVPPDSEPSVPRSEVVAMRSRLNRKLSEANTYNRFLLREIQYREDALRDTKALLVALSAELTEISSAAAGLTSFEGALPTESLRLESRPSSMLTRLEGLRDSLDKQLAGVDAMRLRDVPLIWFGMAEDVRVMGSFDGWTYGEQMSPETTGSMTRFSTVLKLRPGRYEIKFLVDGEWRVAPEWPTVGHGMTENNVLVVE